MKRLNAFLILCPCGFFLLSGCSQTGSGADPGLVDVPVVYAKRATPLDDDGLPIQVNLNDPLFSMPGGNLYLRSSASASATEKNLTRALNGDAGDVKDASANYLGTKVVFALLLPDPDPNNDEDDPDWDIYQYDVVNDTVRRVMVSDSDAEAGNDIAPAYLPDGRIVFVSDRQTNVKQVLSDEVLISGLGKDSFAALSEDRSSKALVLHVMDADGDSGSIEQISFNQSHDLDPTVMPDGRILFSRWEHAASNNSINLYTVNPDGTDLQLYYGDQAASHLDANNDVVQLTQPQVMQDGRILVLSRPVTNSFGGGDLYIIDAENYIDNNRPVFASWGILTGPAQTKATATNVDVTGVSRYGRYGSAFALKDGTNRLIVSKGMCQITNDDIETAVIPVTVHPCIEPYISNISVTEMPPAYGLWIYDLNDNTERPIFAATSGFMLTDVVVLQPYGAPAILSSAVLTGDAAEWADDNVGVLNIRSVYDMGMGRDNMATDIFNCTFYDPDCASTSLAEISNPDVTAAQRPARFLRIIKAVGIPDPDDEGSNGDDFPDPADTAYGPTRNLGMREIIGYAPIEPDGSVKVKVPANIAFAIEVLDANGRRLSSRHNNWLQVKPGETLNCIGCHVSNPVQGQLPYPHGRRDAMAVTINSGVLGGEIADTEIPTLDVPYLGNNGETLAEVKARALVNALNPSVNLEYVDEWTDSDNRAPDASFSYTYASVMGVGGLSTTMPLPSNSPCHTLWQYNCRVVINYVEHIQPIWVATADRPSGSCVSCHTSNTLTAEPAGQLELTGQASDDEAQHIKSYRELFFSDTTQELNGAGALDDKQIPLLDANGAPVLDVNGDPVIVPDPDAVDAEAATMTSTGALASCFVDKMLENTNCNNRTAPFDHRGFLTAAELRLIVEWIDLGGQYFNNPFADGIPE